MKTTIYLAGALLSLGIIGACGSKNEIKSTPKETSATSDPLPSWNDGELKKSIIEYVTSVSTEGNAHFIPEQDRIATFDNDGTLWSEMPLVQGMFAFFRAKQMMQENPSLKNKEPFKAIATNDTAFLHKIGEKEFFGLIMATHTGLTEAEFEKDAQVFYEKAKDPKSGKTIAEMVYKPQVELLQYLRSNGFKTYICSGGTIDFMRPISEKFYGIPPEQVIGTQFKYALTDSTNELKRMPEFLSICDKQSKPVNIQYHIGKRPVFTCGNERSGGDIYMLRYSQGSKYSNFQLLVNHDDAAREHEYQEKDSISLKWAAKYNFHVLSMKNDWKTIF
jgi:phosphoglycolate phosphatase-like HAD superfamily hydrolase